ncbi:unnamed protein product [Plutella xylostella]|uniref:Glycerate kinase n=1 Tax=Plutella xylostella TaxID=51655 RepID=A0A8S4EVP3_PLUXY|nr:unnamed protein product [Plutella xylostella]
MITEDLLKIFNSGVSCVLPENLINNVLKYNPTTENLSVLSDSFSLINKNVYIVGTGKAVKNMAKEAERSLDCKLKRGIISIPVGTLDVNCKSEKLEYFEGALNNLPDEFAVSTTEKINDTVLNLGGDDVLLVLISGGGSALLTLPKKPITLAEKAALVKKLANAGASINELNIVRKKLSDIKGGKMAIKAQPAQVISLILSDIVGDPIDLIASGPTVLNKDKPNDAKEIIEKFDLLGGLPDSVIQVLNEKHDLQTFPENNIKNYVIGSNKISIASASRTANELLYLPIPLSNIVTGNVKDIAIKYVELAKIFNGFIRGTINVKSANMELASLEIPGINPNVLDKLDNNFNAKGICLILGGEITVEVKGDGKGGRNQHLALEFSNIINDRKGEFGDSNVFLLSAGTDGIDGPTDAAGAIGYLGLVEQATSKGINVQQYLDNSDSYNFYKRFADEKLHVIIGHTNTNVMDLHIIIITTGN